ncbi:MAG: hypothetical protein AB7J19_04175 [Beijerinckiaceae bacterium]
MSLRSMAVAPVAAAALCLAATCSAGAQSRAVRATEAMQLATLYADKCKSLKVDWIRLSMLMDKAGVDMEQLTTKQQLAKQVVYYRKAAARLKGLGEAAICRRAIADFGQKGRIAPGIMSDGAGAAAQNKLFDWMYRNGF